MTRALRLGLALALGLPLLAGCSRDSVKQGEARVEPSGVVEVAKGGQAWRRLTEPKTVRDGDRVRVQTGSADVRLPDGELALRAGSEVVIDKSPELVAGDLLVVPRKALTVKSAGSDFAVNGAARLSRSFAVSVASYERGASIRSAGSTLDVPALRQATVPALGQVPARAEPLQYVANDGWDRRFLADAIDLGLELDARSQAASTQYRGQGTTAGFYRTLFPELDSVGDFTAALIGSRPPGEHVVGVGVALAGKDGTFAERWQRAFEFRGQGASWGLVAMDQNVHRVANLVPRIDEALKQATLPGDERRVAQPTRTPASSPGATPPTSGGTGTAPTQRPPTTGTTGTTTQTTLIDPPDTGLVIDPEVDDTVDTIHGLLPGL